MSLSGVDEVWALARSRGMELIGRSRGLGWLDAYAVAMAAVLVAVMLHRFRLPTAGGTLAHTLAGPVAVLGGAVLAALLALLLTRRPWSFSPYAFSMAEVQLLLSAPLDRSRLFKLAARRRVAVVVAAVLALGAVDAVIQAMLFPGHVVLGVLGPIGAIGTSAAGWLWAGYSHHGHAAVRVTALVLGLAAVVLAAVQPLAHLPTPVNPIRVLVTLAVAPALLVDWPFVVAVAAVVIASAGLVLAVRAAPDVPLEVIARRAPLVSQLRFAAARGDTRAVVLLAAAGAAESPREAPWLTWRPRGAFLPWTGAFHVASVLTRWSSRRLLRMALVSIGVAYAVSQVRGHGPAWAWVAGCLAFPVGVQLVEPIAELLDRPGLTRAVPRSQTALFASHLVWSASLSAGWCVAITAAAGPAALASAPAMALVVIAGPLLALAIGPPSVAFLVQATLVGREMAFPIIATRYLAGVLLTAGGVEVLALPAHLARHLALVALVAGVSVSALWWSVRRVTRP